MCIRDRLLWLLSRQPAGSWWRTQHLGVYLALVVVLTIAIAALVHRWVEQPCIRLGHRLARSMRDRPRIDLAGESAAPTARTMPLRGDR